VLITTNRIIEDWHLCLGDTALTTAILDRLRWDFRLRGSYRLERCHAGMYAVAADERGITSDELLYFTAGAMAELTTTFRDPQVRHTWIPLALWVT
jgi:hypothetical protein